MTTNFVSINITIHAPKDADISQRAESLDGVAEVVRQTLSSVKEDLGQCERGKAKKSRGPAIAAAALGAAALFTAWKHRKAAAQRRASFASKNAEP